MLSIVGLGLLAFGLIEGRTYGWGHSIEPFNLFGLSWASGPSPVPVALGIGALALIGFVYRQARLSAGPEVPSSALMDVRLFSIDSFRNGNIATLIIGLGEFGIVAVLPLWLQFALGYSPVQAGLALVPVAIGSFVASGASFGLATKMSALGLVRLGLALEVVGLAGLGSRRTHRQPVVDDRVGVVRLRHRRRLRDRAGDQRRAGRCPRAERRSGLRRPKRVPPTRFGAGDRGAHHDVLQPAQFDAAAMTWRHPGCPTAQADELTRGVTNSAGAAIDGLAAQPQTAFVADIARSAMTHGVTVGSYLAAGFLVLGLIATLLIPRTPAAPEAELSESGGGRHRRG